jgi:hypothetical protein
MTIIAQNSDAPMVSPSDNPHDTTGTNDGQEPSERKFDFRDHLDKLKPDGGKNTKGGDHSFFCPACGAMNFKVNVKTGKSFGWNCECMTTEEGKKKVRDALSPAKKAIRKKAKTVYFYPSRTGEKFVSVVRTDDGNGRKDFKQRRWNGRRWVSNLDNIDRADIAVYHYSEVRAAIARGDRIFVAEGEKTVNALRSLGLVATCNIGGSGKWRESDSQDLTGAKVVLCPDADVPGIKHMDAIAKDFPDAEWLYAYPHSWRWDKLPPNAGLDAADWIDDDNLNRDDVIAAIEPHARKTQEPETPLTKADELRLEIQALLAEKDPIAQAMLRAKLCPRYSMTKAELNELISTIKVRQVRPKPKLMTMGDLLTMKTEALKWIVPGLLPQGETVLVNALPKVGKTLLAVDLAFAVATGGTFLDEQVQQGSVLFVSVDESIRSTRSKLLNRGFRQGDPIHVLPEWDISQMGELETMLEEVRPTLVIVDSLKRITVGRNISENSAEFADSLYQLKELLSRYNAAGLFIHHATKDKEAIGVGKVRGSTAITGAVWGTWLLERLHGGSDFDPRDPMRLLECICRDSEGAKVQISLNPDDFSFSAKYDTAAIQAKTQLQELVTLLQRHSTGLHPKEIEHEYPQIANVRMVLARGVAKGLISQQPAKKGRGSVYSVPTSTKNHVEATPLPPSTEKPVTPNPETPTAQAIEDCNNPAQKSGQGETAPAVTQTCDSAVTPPVTTPKPSPHNDSSDLPWYDGETPGGGGGSPQQKNDPILNKAAEVDDVKQPILISEKANIKHKGISQGWLITSIRDGKYYLRLPGLKVSTDVAVSSVNPDHLIYE